jgi:hypothetical protein
VLAVGESVIEDGAGGSGAGANCSLQPVDLTERGDSAARHPWEVQRFDAYRRILDDHGSLHARQVLDVGAGDSWFAGRLVEHLPTDATVTCWDVNYLDDELTEVAPGVVRTRDRPAVAGDLVLLLDVLEHIEDPAAFIETILAPIVSAETPVLVAVPAHQRLFSAHDEALGHFRRYGRRELGDLLRPWIDVTDAGSLFTSLLLPRAATVVVERLRPPSGSNAEQGIGGWSGGRLLTSVVNATLHADVRVGRLAGRAGIRLPGLSNWAFGVTR